MHPFERALSVCMEDIELTLEGYPRLPWSEHLLNPRRLRGSDFLMRWSQGVWSEDRIIHAINDTAEFFALAYGPSGTAPDDDPRAFELYFERLEDAGLGSVKRPDLLVFRVEHKKRVNEFVKSLGGAAELPFVPESRLGSILALAVAAIECENSLWIASKMPAYGTPLKPMARLGGKPGLPKSAIVPTIILKDEDRAPLRDWQSGAGAPIHIWHAFFDMAFGISLDTAEALITSGAVEETQQTFQAPGGATSSKSIYKIAYHHAYRVATAGESPRLEAACIEDKNGHILPYVRFEGGSMNLDEEAASVLQSLVGGNAP